MKIFVSEKAQFYIQNAIYKLISPDCKMCLTPDSQEHSAIWIYELYTNNNNTNPGCLQQCWPSYPAVN